MADVSRSTAALWRLVGAAALLHAAPVAVATAAGAGADGFAPQRRAAKTWPAGARRFGAKEHDERRRKGFKKAAGKQYSFLAARRGAGDGDDASCDVPCPEFPHGDNERLERLLGKGKVSATKSEASRDVTPDRPLHLFIMALAFTGTSALEGLLLTSPTATSLCASGVWMCEGVLVLIEEGLIESEETRWDEDQPEDWGKALEAYEKWWDPDFPVRLDKSPPNIAKVERLLKHFEETGKQAAFLFMTHSSCAPGHTGDAERIPQLVAAIKSVQASDMPSLVVKYEDLILNPHEVAKAILDFVPALGSLDPGRSGLADVQVDGYSGRNISIAEYILQNAPFESPACTDATHSSFDRDMGYDFAQSLAIGEGAAAIGDAKEATELASAKRTRLRTRRRRRAERLHRGAWEMHAPTRKRRRRHRRRRRSFRDAMEGEHEG